MASIGTTDFVNTNRVEPPPFSLIEHKGLLRRLANELRQSVEELKRNPKAFVLALLSPDGRDARRQRRLYAGLLIAVSVHVAFLIVVAVAGWHRFMAPIPSPVERAQIIHVPPREGTLLDAPAGSESTKPKGDSDGGGGGGGQRDPKPAMKGPAPQFVPRPPLVAINSTPAPNPALAVPATVVGPESAPPPPVPPGDPSSKGSEPSGGPGSGSGVGTGKGQGAGPGVGAGSGPGKGQGPGFGIDSGDPNGVEGASQQVDYRRTPPTGFVPFRWLYRPTPVTTPEAQREKVIGDVLLRATFNANGVISDIEVVNPVEYMTDSAIEALRRSRFKPATINGKPVTLRNVPIRVAVHY